MISYCGINCEECPAYKGTINVDVSLLEKASSLYGNGKTTSDDWVCLGCKEKNIRLLAKNCSDCPIRKCALNKGYDYCAQCDDLYKCDFIKGFLSDKESIIARFNSLIYKKTH